MVKSVPLKTKNFISYTWTICFVSNTYLHMLVMRVPTYILVYVHTYYFHFVKATTLCITLRDSVSRPNLLGGKRIPLGRAIYFEQMTFR
jgi:hypothetical protein